MSLPENDPDNHLHPDWSPPDVRYVHDWRAYIGEELRLRWQEFGASQRLLLARNAQQIAESEDWN